MTSRAGQPSGPGIVLAGGASRRLGAAGRKEWIRLGGRTLLERVVDAVAAETSRVLVVTAPDRLLPPLSRPVDIVHDSAPGQGPLAALLDGMRVLGDGAAGRPVVVASCDLPLLKRDVVRILLDRAAASHADWTVPEIGGHPQMLCSVLRASLTGTIAAWIARGRRDLRGLLDALRAEGAARVCMVAEGAFSAVDPTLESFRDVDTAADCDAIGGQLPYGDRPGAAYTPPS